MPTDFLGRVMVVFNRYGMSMLQGAGVSLKIALVGTLVGCLIGFAVGIVQTFVDHTADLKCLCGIFQGYTYDGPGYVYLLWPYAFAGN